MKKLLMILACALSGVVLAASPVHTEKLKIGTETITVGFSEFPPRAERSLDWTFAPEGGIAGKKGTIGFIRPDGTPDERLSDMPLPRFTRDRSVWGLDSIALPLEGIWQIEIKLDGVGSGRLPVTLLERPAGPPNGLIWSLSSLPVFALLVMGARAWRRVRPGRLLATHTWEDFN